MSSKEKDLEDRPSIPKYLAGNDKRSVILRAAQKLFLQDGFAVTSMDAITKEAGVSKATVYAHFDSKVKLFETLIRVGSESVLKSMPPLERSGGDPHSELRAFFEPFLSRLLGSGGFAWSRMLIAEARRHPENARLFFECTTERITRSVEQYLLELSVDGLFPKKDIRLSAEALVAMALLGPIHRALLVGPDTVDVQGSIEFGIALLLKNSTGV